MKVSEELEEQIRQKERERIAGWLESSNSLNSDHQAMINFLARKIRKNDLEFKTLKPQEE